MVLLPVDLPLIPKFCPICVTPFQVLELNAQPRGGVAPVSDLVLGAAPPEHSFPSTYGILGQSVLNDARSLSLLLIADDRCFEASECGFGVTARSLRCDTMLL